MEWNIQMMKLKCVGWRGNGVGREKRESVRAAMGRGGQGKMVGRKRGGGRWRWERRKNRRRRVWG